MPVSEDQYASLEQRVKSIEKTLGSNSVCKAHSGVMTAIANIEKMQTKIFFGMFGLVLAVVVQIVITLAKK